MLIKNNAARTMIFYARYGDIVQQVILKPMSKTEVSDDDPNPTDVYQRIKTDLWKDIVAQNKPQLPLLIGSGDLIISDGDIPETAEIVDGTVIQKRMHGDALVMGKEKTEAVVKSALETGDLDTLRDESPDLAAMIDKMVADKVKEAEAEKADTSDEKDTEETDTDDDTPKGIDEYLTTLGEISGKELKAELRKYAASIGMEDFPGNMGAPKMITRIKEKEAEADE